MEELVPEWGLRHQMDDYHWLGSVLWISFSVLTLLELCVTGKASGL